MVAITLTEFRRNYKEYLERVESEKVILTNKGRTYELMFRPRRKKMDNDTYFANPAVREHLRQSEQEEREGKGRIMGMEEIRRQLGL
jgi:antitoxin (DNA-binding transcriptional repressor) of toxin-antitoxin stability system